MNIIVIGGKGFVGSAFVRVARGTRAAGRRHRVTVVSRQNYDRHRGRSCDLLINANGNTRKYRAERNPIGEFRASVLSVLRTLLDFPARRYVYLSSIDVYPQVSDPRCNRETAAIHPEKLSRYGLHKYLAEQLVRQYAASWLICRLGGMVGPGLWKNPIYDILHNQPLWVHASSDYQFMLTDDVAKTVLSLARLQPENDVFNVCGDGCISVADAARAAGRPLPAYASPDARREHYEINVEKLKSLVAVARTEDSVRRFLARKPRY